MTSLVRSRKDYETASEHTQQLMQRLDLGLECNLIVVGDSTGVTSDRWVYRLATKLGLDFPTHTVRYREWDIGAANYGAITTIQTGTLGGINLNIWNGSIAGSTANRFSAELAAAVNPSSMGADADLVMLSYGHNGGNDNQRQYPMESGMVAEVARLLPFTPIIIVGQNPVTTDESMAEKVRVFRAMAITLGCGWLDVHSYFKDYAQPPASYYLDTVHPNSAGSELWANAVHAAFKINRHGRAGAGMSPLNRGIIYNAESYQLLNQWALTGGLTAARDAAVFESRGESLKLSGTSSGSAYISKSVIDSNDILAYRGRYVTINVRLLVPDGASVDAGRVALYDGTTTVLTANGGPQKSKWVTQAVTIKVGNLATSLMAYVYLSTSLATADQINIDRVTVSDGPLPRDAVTLREFRDLKFLQVQGNDAAGPVVLRNAANAARCLQILDAVSGTDQDDPAVKYKVSLSASGYASKAVGDDYDSVQIDANTGTIYFGLGVATPDFGFSAGGANLLRLSNADLYPTVDNNHDIGISGKRWRTAYVGKIILGGFQGIYTGAGGPNGVVVADPGSLYLNQSGGAGATLWVKESGAGNTGWVAK